MNVWVPNSKRGHFYYVFISDSLLFRTSSCSNPLNLGIRLRSLGDILDSKVKLSLSHSQIPLNSHALGSGPAHSRCKLLDTVQLISLDLEHSVGSVCVWPVSMQCPTQHGKAPPPPPPSMMTCPTKTICFRRPVQVM